MEGHLMAFESVIARMTGGLYHPVIAAAPPPRKRARASA
jgi:hypothetical protein